MRDGATRRTLAGDIRAGDHWPAAGRVPVASAVPMGWGLRRLGRAASAERAANVCAAGPNSVNGRNRQSRTGFQEAIARRCRGLGPSLASQSTAVAATGSSERPHHHHDDDDHHQHGRDLVGDPIEALRAGVAVLQEVAPPARQRTVKRRQQRSRRASFTCHQPSDQSIMPGVSTSRMPNVQVAIIAGLMICLNRRRSITLNRSLSATRAPRRNDRRKPRQIEHARHPGDHRDDVERLGPRIEPGEKPIVMRPALAPARACGQSPCARGQVRPPAKLHSPGPRPSAWRASPARAAMKAGIVVLRRDPEIAGHPSRSASVAILDVEFDQGLGMLGDEGDRHHQHRHAVVRRPLDLASRCWASTMSCGVARDW